MFTKMSIFRCELDHEARSRAEALRCGPPAVGQNRARGLSEYSEDGLTVAIEGGFAFTVSVWSRKVRRAAVEARADQMAAASDRPRSELLEEARASLADTAPMEKSAIDAVVSGGLLVIDSVSQSEISDVLAVFNAMNGRPPTPLLPEPIDFRSWIENPPFGWEIGAEAVFEDSEGGRAAVRKVDFRAPEFAEAVGSGMSPVAMELAFSGLRFVMSRTAQFRSIRIDGTPPEHPSRWNSAAATAYAARTIEGSLCRRRKAP